MSNPPPTPDVPDDEAAQLRRELAGLMTPAEAKCAICHADLKTHREMERAGDLHHQFSRGGELVQSSPTPERRRVLATPDLVLRMALVDKGLVTAEDLLRAEAKLRDVPAPGAGGVSRGDGDAGRPDSRDRPDEGS